MQGNCNEQKWVIQIRMQTSSYVHIATCKPISDVRGVMKHFTVAESIKNCTGGNTRTSAVHLRYMSTLVACKVVPSNSLALIFRYARQTARIWAGTSLPLATSNPES